MHTVYTDINTGIDSKYKSGIPFPLSYNCFISIVLKGGDSGRKKTKQKSDRYLFFFSPLEIYFLVMAVISLTYVSNYNSEGTLEDSPGLKIGIFFLYMV